jgi:hypothetical protein
MKIAAAFQEYLEKCWPNGAHETLPPLQRQELRRAFYAGAAALLCLTLADVEGDTAEDHSHAEAALISLADEIAEFSDAVGRGTV